MKESPVAIGAIEVPGDRARVFDAGQAEALAAIMGEQGQVNAITLRAAGAAGRFVLVSGMHRLEAAKLLGWPEIMARLSTAATDDEARLEEVMENLGRQELVAPDRCQHLFELKQVWERMYPETRNGWKRPGAGRNASQTGDVMSEKIKSRNPTLDFDDAPEVFGFVRATAERVGLGPTQIKQAVRIWARLEAGVRRRLAGTDLARKMTELAALAELDPALQARVVALILDPAVRDVQNVAQALMAIDEGRARSQVEKRVTNIRAAFAGLPDPLFDMVISSGAARVKASLARLGML